MQKATSGNTVKVHYTGTFDDGSQFDSSRGGEPLELTLGQGQVIPGFEQALEGMAVGDSKSINIPAAEAYGEYAPEMVQQVERSNIPEDIELQLGIQLQAQSPEGQTFLLTVTALDEQSVTLDGNHPLAGKPLNFDLEMMAIA